MATRKKKGLKSWITYLILALTSGGVGGWQVSDHPIAQKLLHLLHNELDAPGAVQAAPVGQVAASQSDPKTVSGLIKSGLSKVIDSATTNLQAGIFEVRVDKVALAPTTFKQGRTLDLQVRVRKIDTHGNEGTIWDSEQFGQRLAEVGRDDLTASWTERPFRVAWQPGEQFVVEVWDKSRWTKTRWFVMDQPDGAGAFPLRSGDHSLSLVARNMTPQDRPEANQLTLSSKRVGDLPGGSVPASAGPARTAATEGGRLIR